MGLNGRFFSDRDLKVMGSWNAELMGEVIQTVVTIFKMAPELMTVNVYGEVSSETGKMFHIGVDMTAIIDRADIDTNYDDFGPDRNQTVVYKFREDNLKLVNLYPQIGDMVLFNERYHEIDNVIQEQFLGGQDKKSHSIIVNTHYARLSKLNLVERQV